MRIAHVITRLLRAGSEENTILTCLGHAAAGHQIFLIHGADYDPTHYDEIGSAFRLMMAGSLVHPVDPIRDVRAVGELRQLFRELCPDIVHTHQSKAGIVGRTAARAAGVPLIVHGVHILPFLNVGPVQKGIYLTAERATASFTDAFINVSSGMRDAGLSHGVGKPEQHHVVHSGMELDRFGRSEIPADWRSLIGVGEHEPKPPVVLMLAALEPRKRHVELIEAFTRVVARVPNVRLVLAGEGPYRAEVEAAIMRSRLAGTVKLIGYYKQPERLMALADICLLTSMREGLPRVAVQYLAAGRPVVVSELPGIGEIVQDGVNGLVTPRLDLAAAADAVADLLGDPGRLARMSTAAAQTDVSSWAAETMCKRIWEIYEQIS
jgi:glycosyltransferase involved in cell wall biosynthesis